MQRTRLDRRKLKKILIAVFVIAVFVAIDQLSKLYFVNLDARENLALNPKKVFGDFFYFSFLYNTGSAYGMLSSFSWAQTFFKIVTPVAMVIFSIMLAFSLKNGYKFFSLALAFIIGGTMGNYLDRIILGKVVDFLCIEISGNRIFGVFNVADVFLSVGIVMAVIHFLFLDKNAVFGKKNDKRKDKNRV